MFTMAPSLDHNGDTHINSSLRYRDEVTPLYPTLSLAKAQLKNYNGTGYYWGSATWKSGMRNGCVGFRRYKFTPYSATYARYTSSGRLDYVLPSGVSYRAMSSVLIFNGEGASGGNGITENLNDLNLVGSLPSLEAVYNNTAINSATFESLSRCYKKAANIKFDTAEFLSGIPQTVTMVAERTTQVLRAWNAVRKGNYLIAFEALGLSPRRIKNFRLKDAHDVWLELHYGWAPLLNDIVDGVKLVNSILKPDPIKKRMFSVVSRRSFDLKLRPLGIRTDMWTWDRRLAEAQGSVETGFVFGIKDSLGTFLNSLQLFNPLYTVWVGLPFSFVVDWLIPVGDWLNALTSTIGLQFVDGYTTTRSWGRAWLEGCVRKHPFFAFKEGDCSASAEISNIKRVVYTSWPRFPPYIRFPFSSDTRIISAIALVGASRSRRFAR